MKAVTVLMPVYNAAPFLKESIESILNQTVTEFDFLIIDDGSTDGSALICNHYAAQDDRITVLVNKKNAGLIQTLKTGIERIKTPIIARMDADDRSHPQRLEKQLNLMKQQPAVAMCGSHYQFFGRRSEVITMPTSVEALGVALLWKAPLLHGALMIRREVFKTHMFDRAFMHAEDYGFLMQTYPQYPMANSDDVLYFYRVGTHNTCVKHRHYQLLSHEKIRGQLLVKLGWQYDKKTLRLFHLFAESDYYSFGYLELVTLETLLHTVIDLNKTAQLFDQKTLEAAISTKFFWACFYSTKQGLPIYWVYQRSLLKQKAKVSCKYTIEFFFRALFRIRK